jgi:hypothetical protein
MGRTIIVGDIHGCRFELEELLERLAYCSSDRLCFVGDLVARGPDSVGVVSLCRRLGAVVVRGNHEEKLLRWRRTQETGEGCESLGGMHLDIARRLGPADWAFLDATPLWLDLPAHGLRIVHAGVVPGVPIEQQPRRALLTMRALGHLNEPLEKAGSVPWGSRYLGPVQVVFGHHAQPRPQLHPFATGIDTGCVYGGALTAMVLDDDEPVPSICERPGKLFSVDAHRRWFGGGR